MLAQSLDTNIDIEQIQISLLRKKSLATKFSHVTALSQTTRQLSKRAIKRANPKLNDLELNYLFIKYLYNIELTNYFTREQAEHMKKNDLLCAPRSENYYIPLFGQRYIYMVRMRITTAF